LRMPQKQVIKETNLTSLDLKVNGIPSNFLFKTMEEVEIEHKDDIHLPHRHNYYTIIWVTRGSGTHHIDFKTYQVKEDVIFFISPEQVHDLQMQPNHSGFVMLFTTDFIEQNGIPQHWLQDSGFFFRCDDVAPLLIPESCDKSRLLQLIEGINTEFRQQKKFYQEAIGSMLKLFLLECKRIYSTLPAERIERSHSGGNLIKQFKDLLDNRFKEWHKVAEYAQALHITPNYLNEIVTQETGNSAKDMILNRIMLEAKRFATYSETSVKEVAYNLGFEDPAHFSKLFKNQEEQGFTDFRASIRKKYS
jgi:AraC family transcriptional regulator, transcriptional activator of pobA